MILDSKPLLRVRGTNHAREDLQGKVGRDIQLTYPNNQNVLLTCGYRSNGVLLNLTQNQQNERFFVHFDELLHKISQKQVNSYIFLDSNFDLLSLDQNGPRNYLNSILSSGYIQCICKATRMQNESRTLLDQILV
jgi:hypothetical protein